jgi:hypothetical protein
MDVIEKTHLMRDLEVAYGGRDIRDILVEVIAEARTDEMAACALSIQLNRPINETIISHWIRRLQILEPARAARKRRGMIPVN